MSLNVASSSRDQDSNSVSFFRLYDAPSFAYCTGQSQKMRYHHGLQLCVSVNLSQTAFLLGQVWKSFRVLPSQIGACTMLLRATSCSLRSGPKTCRSTSDTTSIVLPFSCELAVQQLNRCHVLSEHCSASGHHDTVDMIKF